MYLQEKQSKGGHNKQSAQHFVTIVNQLKLQLMNGTKQFKEVLEQRSKTMMSQQQRRGKFGQDNGAVLAKPRNFLPRPQANQLSPNADSSGVVAPMDAAAAAQLQALIPDQSYLQQRANAVGDIESSIASIGQIYHKLGSLVAEQGEQVERIDDDIEQSLVNVNAGKSELEKYLKSVSGNRVLMMKLFAILMFFTVMFVMLM
jgi:syntaxin 5